MGKGDSGTRTGTVGLTGCRVDILPTVFASEDVVDLFPLQVRPLDVLFTGKRDY